jgi:hypothetical protein
MGCSGVDDHATLHEEHTAAPDGSLMNPCRAVIYC